MSIDAATRRAQRLALIARAAEHLRTASQDELRDQLSHPDVNLYDHLQRDPDGFAEILPPVDAASDSFALYGAFKRAQHILLAAGLPYMPDDYATQAERDQESEDR